MDLDICWFNPCCVLCGVAAYTTKCEDIRCAESLFDRELKFFQEVCSRVGELKVEHGVLLNVVVVFHFQFSLYGQSPQALPGDAKSK